MKKPGDLLIHPLWVFPMFLLVFVGFIESLHTTAHLHGEIDVHGLCKNNKEYIESKEDDYY